MKRYKCKKQLILDLCDADGFYVDGEYRFVEVGEVYETYDDYRLEISDKPAVHLERVHENICGWIEVYPETLDEYFEEMVGDES